MNRLRLSDVYTYDDIVDGKTPFKYIVEHTSLAQLISWLDTTNATYLDEKLILEHSGDKYISPLFSRLLKLNERDNPPDITAILCSNIVNTYADKWNKIYDALIDSDYNPLENYDMEEVETPDVTKEKTTDVKTKMITSSSGDSSNDVYGFNSANPSPSTESEASSQVTIEGNNEDNVSHDLETETGTRELTRHGNIGVTTSQQLLEAEVTLRNKNNFYKMVLNDVSSILCLSVY